MDKMDTEIAVEQTGFSKGIGTRNQIISLRIIMEKTREFSQPLFPSFLDFRKAFGSAGHDKLWLYMLNMGFPPHLAELLRKLYKGQKAYVRVFIILTDWFQVNKEYAPCLGIITFTVQHFHRGCLAVSIGWFWWSFQNWW